MRTAMSEELRNLARRLPESPGDLHILEEFRRQARRHGLDEEEQLAVEVEWARASYEADMLGEHLDESVPIMRRAERIGLVHEGEYQNYDLSLSRREEFRALGMWEDEEDARESEARKVVKGFIKYLNKLVDSGRFGEALEGSEFFRHKAELESDEEASVYYVVIGSRSQELREALRRKDKELLRHLDKLEEKAYDWLERKTDSVDNEPLMQPPDMEVKGKLVVFPLTMMLATWDPPRWAPGRYHRGREDRKLKRAGGFDRTQFIVQRMLESAEQYEPSTVERMYKTLQRAIDRKGGDAEALDNAYQEALSMAKAGAQKRVAAIKKLSSGRGGQQELTDLFAYGGSGTSSEISAALSGFFQGTGWECRPYGEDSVLIWPSYGDENIRLSWAKGMGWGFPPAMTPEGSAKELVAWMGPDLRRRSGSDDNLRRDVIRLAHSKPDLRADLLPLLRKEASTDEERYLEDVGKHFQRKYGLTYEIGENAYGTGPEVSIWDEGDEPYYAATLTVDIDDGELNISVHQGRSGKNMGFYDVPPLSKTISTAESYARKHSDLLPK